MPGYFCRGGQGVALIIGGAIHAPEESAKSGLGDARGVLGGVMGLAKKKKSWRGPLEHVNQPAGTV